MLSRWGNQHSLGIRATRLKMGSIILAPVSPSLTAEFDWPKMAEISKVQPDYLDKNKWKLENGVWRNLTGEIFIPKNEAKLKTRLLIAAHAGASGHRAVDTTLANLVTRFWCKNRDHDVRSFVASCLHCISTTSRDMVPRPLGHALQATKINEVLHFDYC